VSSQGSSCLATPGLSDGIPLGFKEAGRGLGGMVDGWRFADAVALQLFPLTGDSGLKSGKLDGGSEALDLLAVECGRPAIFSRSQ
jgi:hypothetical protein